MRQFYGAGWDSPGFLTVDQFKASQYDNVSNPTDGGIKWHGLERAWLRVVHGSSIVWRTTAYSTQGDWNFYLTIPPEPGSGEGSGSQTQEIDHRIGYGATSALTWIGERTEVTVGAEGRLDRSDYRRWFTTNRTEDSADALINARQISGALFLQTTEDLGQHVRFSVGARYDALDTRDAPVGDTVASASHGIFSPKLGALVHVPRIGDVYANVSRGFRSTDGVIEDPTLPFITEWAYEAGLHAVIHHVNTSAAFFRTDVSNEQSFDPVLLTTTNGGRSRRQGVELTLGATLGSVARFSGRWTFTNAKYLDQLTPGRCQSRRHAGGQYRQVRRRPCPRRGPGDGAVGGAVHQRRPRPLHAVRRARGRAAGVRALPCIGPVHSRRATPRCVSASATCSTRSIPNCGPEGSCRRASPGRSTAGSTIPCNASAVAWRCWMAWCVQEAYLRSTDAMPCHAMPSRRPASRRRW